MVMQECNKEAVFHSFGISLADIVLPVRLNNPFDYEPDPLCLLAAGKVQTYLKEMESEQGRKLEGKMFGVLVVTDGKDIGFLAAFSGNLAGEENNGYFVPPICDLQDEEGFFKTGEREISAINRRIEMLEQELDYLELKEALDALLWASEEIFAINRQRLQEAKARRAARRQENPGEEELAAMVRESQYEKASFKRLKEQWNRRILEIKEKIEEKNEEIERLKRDRKERSAVLQREIFDRFMLKNCQGESKSLYDVFQEAGIEMPPAGAGECAAPKLLQYAYEKGFQPIAIAEFWWGKTLEGEVRRQGYFYPACKSKCGPILGYMLEGLNIDKSIWCDTSLAKVNLKIVYEDKWLVVVNKPAGLLSVPGKTDQMSVYDWARSRYPEATGPLIVHRLDMDTSGLLILAKTKEVHMDLQRQFLKHSVHKWYVAILDGMVYRKRGYVNLPLCPCMDDRPRQIVSREFGKKALTRYWVLDKKGKQTRVCFLPLTGRTHQLRVHAAHPEGLDAPILGDKLYGRKAERMYLHASEIEFVHPYFGQKMHIKQEPDF